MTDKDLRRAEAIVKKIHPLLTGKGSHIQGAVLADLVATWLAGHHPALREESLRIWIAAVEGLIPENEKQMFGDAGFPEHPQ